jgi:hypothetical protein
VTALRNAIAERVPHAPCSWPARRRQTTSRASSRSLNCDEARRRSRAGTAPPLEIAAGTRSTQEIDAASNTGVANVRDPRSARHAAAPEAPHLHSMRCICSSTAAFNAAEDAGGAAAPSLFIRDDRSPEDPGHGAVAGVALRPALALERGARLLRKICAADSIDAPEAVLRATCARRTAATRRPDPD